MNGRAASLLERVEARIREWGVEPESRADTASSVLVFGRRAGKDVVLKVARRRGSEWLAGLVIDAFRGRGMVRVLELADGAVLLERLRPATTLAGMALAGEDLEATEICADLMVQMLPVEPAVGTLTVGDWGSTFGKYLATPDRRVDRDLVMHGRAIYTALAATQRAPRLLHGDLHHHNILLDSERGWVAVDPKGVIGELEFELGAFLRNPVGQPELLTLAHTEARLERFMIHLGFNDRRALSWAFAQAVLSTLWTLEDGGVVRPDHAGLVLAEALLPRVAPFG